MPEIAGSIEIAAPVEAVFGFASDLANELTWNPEARSVRQVTPGPVRVGTVFLARWSGSPELEVTCTAYDAPTRWRYQNGGPLEVDSLWTCAPTGSGTTLSGTMTITGHGIGKLFAPLFVRRMRRLIPGNLERIRTAVESQRATLGG